MTSVVQSVGFCGHGTNGMACVQMCEEGPLSAA